MRTKVYDLAHEVETTLKMVDEKAIDSVVTILKEARNARIFVVGLGRSGLVAKCYAMRMMHLGYKTYVVGEVVTPAIGKGDVLLVVSGSGETESLVCMVKKAAKIGAKIILFTIFSKSSVSQYADQIVRIPASTSKVEYSNESIDSIQPMGNLFEQSVLLLLDYLVMCLMDFVGTNSKDMFTRHANLE